MPTMKYVIAILIGALLLLGSIIFLSLKCFNLKDELAATQTNFAAAVEANKSNMSTIEDLYAELNKRDQLIKDMSDSMAIIAKERDDARSAFKNMVTENPEVRSWATIPVPDNVWQLFNENGGGDTN